MTPTPEKQLEAMTAGGSEFVDDPQRCLDDIKERLAVAGRVAAERNRLRAQLAVSEQARQRAEKLLREIGQANINLNAAAREQWETIALLLCGGETERARLRALWGQSALAQTKDDERPPYGASFDEVAP